MDVLPGGSTAPPDDDDAARYEAALELNARLRAQAAQIPDDGAGYGPSDGEGADDDSAHASHEPHASYVRKRGHRVPRSRRWKRPAFCFSTGKCGCLKNS